MEINAEPTRFEMTQEINPYVVSSIVKVKP